MFRDQMLEELAKAKTIDKLITLYQNQITKIRDEFGNLESNIPVNNAYWGILNKLRAAQAHKKELK